MSNDNTCTIIGRLSRDPELRFSPSGVAVCSFGLAWSPRKKNAQTGEWEDGETSWFNCTAWRTLGENIAASLTKGARVIVTGTVSVRQWEDKDGNKRTSVEIDVEDCGPVFPWDQAEVVRAERSTSGGGGGRKADPIYGEGEPF